MPGLQSAAQQLQQYGRGRDTLLAHISPDEAQFIDKIQGGRRTNPMTGLPEYSLFGKILKAVVRVGASIGGFALGGPAGAAAASGIATKLTGGSWKDALKGAAFSGIGGELGQGLSGNGWNVLGNNTALSNAIAGGSSAAAGAGAGAGAGEMTLSGLENLTPATQGALDTAVSSGAIAHPTMASVLEQAAPEATGSGLGSIASAIPGGYGGLGAGLGALSTPLSGPGSAMDPGGPPPGFGSNINLKVAPQTRQYRPFTGDYAHYGEPGGGSGWQFFDNVNPAPQFQAKGGRIRARYAEGGQVQDTFENDPGNPGWPSWQKDQAVAHNIEAVGEAARQIPPQKRTARDWNDIQSFIGFWGTPDKIWETEEALLNNYKKTQGHARGGPIRHYGIGGGVMAPQGPNQGLGGLASLRNPGIPSQIQSPQMANPQALRAQAQNLSPAAQRMQIRQAAILGYQSAKSGGEIHGPGTETSDSIPAMLSENEHVIDAGTIRALGHGNMARGHKAVERFKRQARASAGVPNPNKPPAFQGEK